MDDVKPGPGDAKRSSSMQDTDLDSETIDDETWSRMLEATQLLQQPVATEEQAPNISQCDIDETLLQEALLAFHDFSSSSSIPAPSVTGSEPPAPKVPKLEPVDDDILLIALQKTQAFLGISSDLAPSSEWPATTPPTSSTTTLEPRPTVLQSNTPRHIHATAAEPAISQPLPLATASPPQPRTPDAEPVSGEYHSTARADHIPSTSNARGSPYPDLKHLIRFPAEELERPDPRPLQQDFYKLLDPTYCIFRGANLETIFRLDSEMDKNWGNAPDIYPPSHFVSAAILSLDEFCS